jgi:hypothetical protein
VAAATAQAAETLGSANAEAYRFNADRRAYADGGRAFLLERSYSDLNEALKQTPLTILDHRLAAAQAPFLDLRSPAATPGVSPAIPATSASGAGDNAGAR